MAVRSAVERYFPRSLVKETLAETQKAKNVAFMRLIQVLASVSWYTPSYSTI
jgi:hypothetical protein